MIWSREPVTMRNGPGTDRGAAATVVSAYGKRRQENGRRTTRRFALGTVTRASAKSQWSGAPARRATRCSAAPTAGALRHVNAQVRKESLATQPRHNPGTGLPVAWSMRNAVG